MRLLVTLSGPGSQALGFAGAELEKYLTRMLPGYDGSLTAALAVEPEGGNDRYDVDMGPEGGTITGNNARSVLLGVYAYLHRLGCRFLAPGARCEVVPTLTRPEAVRMGCRASFFHRGVCIEGANSLENVVDFIDWLPKVGFNSFFLQFRVPYSFLARWYTHENNPLAAGEPYPLARAEAAMARFEAELQKRGLLLHKVGHGWTGQVLGYDSLTWDTDPAPLPDALRHRAALVNGVRDLFGGVPTNTNLCYHNGDAVDAFAALVVDYARRNPQVDYLHIWLADGCNNVCQCAGCAQTTPSDQYVALLNEIDRRLTAEKLETKIVFLLYQELLWPPIRQRLRHEERFVMMFAPFSRTFAASYDLENVPEEIPPYRRNRIVLPTGLGENLAFLKKWQARFRGDSFVYDYPLGRAHYGDFGYLHIARTIHADIRKLRQMGLNGYISCQELRVTLPNALPNYVMGRTLFDETLPAEDLIREYFTAAYGADAPAIEAYLDALSARNCCDYISGKGSREDPTVARNMARIRQICDHAAPLICGHSEQGLFRRLLAHHRQYVLLLSRALCHLARGEEAQARAGWEAMRDYICRLEPEFQPYFDVYRALNVTGDYAGLRNH